MDGEFAVEKKLITLELLWTLNFLQPPLSSKRPHVIGYNITHNASEIVQMYGTNDTGFVLESASPNLFIFTVAPINVLGTGEEIDITSELYTHYNNLN